MQMQNVARVVIVRDPDRASFISQNKIHAIGNAIKTFLEESLETLFDISVSIRTKKPDELQCHPLEITMLTNMPGAYSGDEDFALSLSVAFMDIITPDMFSLWIVPLGGYYLVSD